MFSITPHFYTSAVIDLKFLSTLTQSVYFTMGSLRLTTNCDLLCQVYLQVKQHNETLQLYYFHLWSDSRVSVVHLSVRSLETLVLEWTFIINWLSSLIDSHHQSTFINNQLFTINQLSFSIEFHLCDFNSILARLFIWKAWQFLNQKMIVILLIAFQSQ